MMEHGSICGIDLGSSTSVLCTGRDVVQLPTCVAFTRLQRAKTGDDALSVLRQNRLLALRNVESSRCDVYSPSLRMLNKCEDKLMSTLLILIRQLLDRATIRDVRRCVFTLPASATSQTMNTMNATHVGN